MPELEPRTDPNPSAGAARHAVIEALRGAGVPKRTARDIVYTSAREAKTPDEVSLCIRHLIAVIGNLFR